MNIINFKKELKELYNPTTKDVVIVDVPILNFLMIDDLIVYKGNPNDQPQKHLKKIR